MRVLLCVLAIAVVAGPVASQTYISGDIVGADEDWTPAGSPYIIQSNVRVTAATLTIQSSPSAGVTVAFDGEYYLGMEGGSIVVIGNADHPVVFTSNAGSPAPSDWAWVQTAGLQTGSFSHCIFEYGQYGLCPNGHDTPILNCEFRYCSTAGVNCLDASPTIQNCDIHDNDHGIYISNSLDQDLPVVHNCNLYNNSIANIRFGLFPAPAAVLDAENNWWGTDVESEIQLSIRDGNDYPDVYATVDYDPWLHEVPVEATSWGRLKALFAE